MSERALRLALAGVVFVALGAPARAEMPNLSVYPGLSLGGHIVADDWDLGPSITPASSMMITLRGGVQLEPWIAAEASLGFVPYAGDGVAMLWSADAVFHWDLGDWNPIGVVGLGVYHNVGGEPGSDADFQLHYGIGARGMLVDWLALRAEVRHYVTDPVGDGAASNFEVSLGFDVFAWVANAAPPPDGDGDGIADADDKCPTVKGPEATDGCPDRDGDGIADADDKCPDAKGARALLGCPDGDGDGVADPDDRCPTTKGPASNNGCPPKPTDRDKDGILDAQDRCPDTPGVKAHQGCADRDGDHIADPDDKCPDQAGIKAEQGCLPAAVAKFSGAIEGIYFGSGSARIKKKSFKVLDGAAKALKEFDGLRVGIEGHTDNKGNLKKNLKLSQKRAESVKAYLVKKGIAADRLDAKGYGPERPVADNKTKDGRAKNRRIEFRILSK